MRFFLPLLLLLAISCSQKEEQRENYTDYVDNFMGTGFENGVFPGAVLPYAMVQLSPDTAENWMEKSHSYRYGDKIIKGFSHTHIAGMPFEELCDIRIMPYHGEYNPKRDGSEFEHTREGARPGYYWVDLKSHQIKAELTATKRVGVHRYEFKKEGNAGILIDLGDYNKQEKPTYTRIKVVGKNRIEGERFSTGAIEKQKIFFVMDFSKDFEKYTLTNKGENYTQEAQGDDVKIRVEYDNRANERIVVRVAISTNSVVGAEKNMSEVEDFDFDAVAKKAKDTWEKNLSKIQIKTNSVSEKRAFYTMLYRSMILPSTSSDADGSYIGLNDSIYNSGGNEKMDNMFFWSAGKTQYPLMEILNKKQLQNTTFSLISQWEQKGKIMKNSLQNNEIEDYGVGTSAIPVIVSAYLKGITMDAHSGFIAGVESMEKSEGGAYKQYGFVPSDKDSIDGHSVSKTLENSYNDWALSVMAETLDEQEKMTTLKSRAEGWKRIFSTQDAFFKPKNSHGHFATYFNAKEKSKNYYRVTPWQTRFYLNHDIEKLIAEMGGRDLFELRLDSVFNYKGKDNTKAMVGMFDGSLPQMQSLPFYYVYTQMPSKSQLRIGQIKEKIEGKEDRLLGQDTDFGAIASWWVMMSLGIYPINPVDGKYAFGLPWFKEITINLENGNKFKIKSRNLSETNKYIKDIYFKNKVYEKMYITHTQIMEGGTLVFDMIDKAQDERLEKYEKP